MLENNTLWKKIKSEYELNYSDLEQYLYTKDYLRIQNLPEYFNYNKDEYNDSFYLYSFVTKKYDDYDDLFFQNFIDGNIPKEEYFEYEYKAIKMLFNLFEKNSAYAFYSCNSDSFYNNATAQKSKNVLTCIDKLEANNEKLLSISNKEFYKNICYIALREIGTVHFIFPELKMIILFSGFHGLMSSEELISDELLNELSEYVFIDMVKWHKKKTT